MSKVAIVLLSDPKAGADESLGRLFNALAAVYEYKQADKEVKLIFQGTGTRWPEVLQNEAHPGHKIFKEIEDKVEGVSSACSDVWGANPSGFDLLGENKIPNTTGVSSFLKLEEEGYKVLIF
ncbi:DsrE family protein [Wenyingzhuangia sp. IMCC45574]